MPSLRWGVASTRSVADQYLMDIFWVRIWQTNMVGEASLPLFTTLTRGLAAGRTTEMPQPVVGSDRLRFYAFHHLDECTLQS